MAGHRPHSAPDGRCRIWRLATHSSNFGFGISDFPTNRPNGMRNEELGMPPGRPETNSEFGIRNSEFPPPTPARFENGSGGGWGSAEEATHGEGHAAWAADLEAKPFVNAEGNGELQWRGRVAEGLGESFDLIPASAGG